MRAFALCLGLLVTTPAFAQTMADARAAWHAGDYTLAGELALPLAEAGDGDAMNLIANLYQDGLGGYPQDDALTLEWFNRALEAGSEAVLNNLGRVHHFGWHGQPINPELAEEFYLRGIETGSAIAMNNYALLLQQGGLGAPDWDQVTDLYEQAHALDEPNAAVNLSVIYLDGEDGLSADPGLARRWAERAYELGTHEGIRLYAYLVELGVGGTPDLNAAIALYEEAYAAGSGSAANDLGTIYWQGAAGVPSDLAQAAVWYERGVAIDHIWSHVNLADLLSDGETTVPDDGVRARDLYSRAYLFGNDEAGLQLAYLYWDGIGGPVDYVQALFLFQDLRAAGNVAAINDMGVMFEQGLGFPADTVSAAELYQEAAEQGHALAAQNLAFLLSDPAFENTDAVEGLAWCYVSAELETDPDTVETYRAACVQLAEGMTTEDKDAAIARARIILQPT